MKLERLILIAFMGNYLINNLVGGIVALIPTSPVWSFFTTQYIAYILLAMITVGLLTWWYFCEVSRKDAIVGSVLFGIGGFVVALTTAFVFGLAGALARSGSLSAMVKAIPDFGPFIWDKSTLILFVIWMVPALIVGWWLHMKEQKNIAVVSVPPSGVVV